MVGLWLPPSMGGAVAIGAATLQPGFECVWNDCSFDSFYDAVYYRVKAAKYPLAGLITTSLPLLRDRCSSQVMIDTFTRLKPRPFRNAAR